ncbi:MAG: serine/threonine protein kinase, partial [Planctomycetaceae bacterium]|nr:serine/threonine protein kinase [Planctomycetaceae bacterium]
AGMRLHHPNIVHTYRMDSTGAIYYLVMELVRGISLHELVALRGPLKWPFACDFALQAATALQAAHGLGIIHRDIKPANFLIEQSGDCHILDFGLALIQDSPDDEFSLSMLFGHNCLGTPDYIAPEQSLDSSSVDCRADVYSLGATFYVALTGRVPFPDKTTRDKLEAHRSRTAANVCSIRKEIPAEV